MERSGWDDDADGYLPPPSQRAWRHPSELGAQARAPLAARRASRSQFALAVAAGAVGSLAIATFAVVIAGTNRPSTSAGLARSDLGGRLLSSTVAATVVNELPATSEPVAAATEPTAVHELASTTTVPLSVPSVVNLRRPAGEVGGTLIAVVVDDTTLLAEPADVTDAARLEAVMPDGSEVSVMVDGVDADSGLVRLKTRGALTATSAEPGTWLGVRCSDAVLTGAAVGPAAADPTTTVTATVATIGLVTSTAPSSVTVPVSAGATSAPTSATTETSGPVASTTAPASTALARTTLPSVTLTPSSPPAPGKLTPTPPTPTPAPATATAATTATGKPSAGLPTVSSTTPTVSSTTPTAATTSTIVAPESRRAVRVHDVVDGSPAATAGVRSGDLIVAVDGRAVRSMWSLVLAVRRHQIGETATIDVLRDGTPMELSAVLAHHPGAGT